METIELSTKDAIAPFWKRVLAFIFDLIIIEMIIISPFETFFNNLDFNSLVNSTDTKLTIITFVILIFSYIYFVSFEWKLGQTPGKILFNLYVAGKEKVSFEQILIRNATKPFFIALAIDVGYMFVRKENQRYFEKLSKTFIIERKFILKKFKVDEKK